MKGAPLSGKRIVVTRPHAQAADLVNRLAALGAQPILFPTIEIAPPEDTSRLDQAINQLSSYHWIIFTSANGVAAFWDRLTATGEGARSLRRIRTAAIGPATARALEERGIGDAFVPREYVAEAIASGIGDVRGRRILLPRADIAPAALAVRLKRRGAIVHEVVAYRTRPAAPDPNGLAKLRRDADAITFTSSSTVRNFVALAGRDTGEAIVACIGPITAATARELSLRVDVVAAEHTVNGLVNALANRFLRACLKGHNINH